MRVPPQKLYKQRARFNYIADQIAEATINSPINGTSPFVHVILLLKIQKNVPMRQLKADTLEWTNTNDHEY